MSFPEVKWGRQVQLGMKCREVTSGWVPVNIHHKGGESQPDPGQWRAGWQASGAFGGPGHSLSLRRVLTSPGRHLGWGRNPVVGTSRRASSWGPIPVQMVPPTSGSGMVRAAGPGQELRMVEGKWGTVIKTLFQISIEDVKL